VNWPDTWRVLFGYEPDAKEAADLEAWLDSVFSARGDTAGWKPSELTDALNAYAEAERAAGRRAKAPTGPQVKTLIIRARYARAQADKVPTGPCALCAGTGWGHAWPDLTDAATLEQTLTAYSVTVPCICLAGDRVWRECEPYKSASDQIQIGNVLAMASVGARQKRAALAAEAAKEAAA
jgi:hypothetical protein